MSKLMKPAFLCALLVALATPLAACGHANELAAATVETTAPAANAAAPAKAPLRPCTDQDGNSDMVAIPEPDWTCEPTLWRATEPAAAPQAPNQPLAEVGGTWAPASYTKKSEVPHAQWVNNLQCLIQFRGVVYQTDAANGRYQYASSHTNANRECADGTEFQLTPMAFDAIAQQAPQVEQAYSEEHDAVAAMVAAGIHPVAAVPVELTGDETYIVLNPGKFWSRCMPDTFGRKMLVGTIAGKELYEYVSDAPPSNSNVRCASGTLYRQGDELLGIPELENWQ